jgi:signal transduction histidine kinase
MTERTGKTGSSQPDSLPPPSSPFDSLFQGQITANNQRLIQARWLAGSLVAAATAFCVHVLRLPLPEVPLYGVGAAILIYNILLTILLDYFQRTGRKKFIARMQRLIAVQVALDWASMAVFLHLTGGICSPAIYIMILHMLMVTILLPEQRPYILVVIGVMVLAGLAALEQLDVLPHYCVLPGLSDCLHRDITYVGSQLVFFTFTSMAATALVYGVIQRLRQRELQITALFHTTQTISSTLSLEEVMDGLARSTAAALNVKGAAIRLLDESGERLDMTAAYGLSESYLRKGPVDVTHSPLDDEALLGHPVIIGEARLDSRIQYPKEVAEEGIRSMLVVPIMRRGRPLGVLRVYSDRPNRFSRGDVAFVLAIAHQGAAALENALAHDELQRADQTRAQFVRLVTHELRAPVTGAQSLLRVLLRELAGDLSDQQQDILGRLGRRLDMLLDLINDLLVLAASKTSAMQETPGRVPLQPVLNQVIERNRLLAEEKSITLRCDMPFEVFAVRGTEGGLLRVFDNLVGNAVKYTPECGEVTVRVVERPPYAVVAVADTGIGIPEADVPNLGKEFFRASNARRSGITGTGLGLSIVRQLVEYYGGLVAVSSVIGQGTTFKISLPLAGPGEL